MSTPVAQPVHFSSGEGSIQPPRGLVLTPDPVREAVARERAKCPTAVFTPETEESLLNEWTIQYNYAHLGLEVTYRPTRQGPEILAVGDEERLVLWERLGEDEFRKLKSWLP